MHSTEDFNNEVIDWEGMGYKVELCQYYFGLNGRPRGCRSGDGCPWAHGRNDRWKIASGPKQRLAVPERGRSGYECAVVGPGGSKCVQKKGLSPVAATVPQKKRVQWNPAAYWNAFTKSTDAEAEENFRAEVDFEETAPERRGSSDCRVVDQGWQSPVGATVHCPCETWSSAHHERPGDGTPVPLVATALMDQKKWNHSEEWKQAVRLLSWNQKKTEEVEEESRPAVQGTPALEEEVEEETVHLLSNLSKRIHQGEFCEDGGGSADSKNLAERNAQWERSPRGGSVDSESAKEIRLAVQGWEEAEASMPPGPQTEPYLSPWIPDTFPTAEECMPEKLQLRDRSEAKEKRDQELQEQQLAFDEEGPDGK